ncbi:MAG: hypothetical protein ACERKD_08995 [Prolixibacteraceae bacterium]
MNSIKNLLVVGLLVVTSNLVVAQNGYSEKITDKWPYLYHDFPKGTLYYDSSNELEANYNIDLANQCLVYFDDDEVVKLVESNITIDSLVFGNSKFYYLDGQLYKELASNNKISLLQKVRIDLSALNNSDGAYGSGSSVDATTNLLSLDISSYTKISYNQMKEKRGTGTELDLITSYYLATDNGMNVSYATKRLFSQLFPDADVKRIVKANNINMKNEDQIRLLFQKCNEK